MGVLDRAVGRPATVILDGAGPVGPDPGSAEGAGVTVATADDAIGSGRGASVSGAGISDAGAVIASRLASGSSEPSVGERCGPEREDAAVASGAPIGAATVAGPPSPANGNCEAPLSPPEIGPPEIGAPRPSRRVWPIVSLGAAGIAAPATGAVPNADDGAEGAGGMLGALCIAGSAGMDISARLGRGARGWPTSPTTDASLLGSVACVMAFRTSGVALATSSRRGAGAASGPTGEAAGTADVDGADAAGDSAGPSDHGAAAVSNIDRWVPPTGDRWTGRGSAEPPGA